MGWKMNLGDVRKTIDARTTSVDTSLDPMFQAQIASDAYESDQFDKHEEILANIPPVMLGKTKYRVVGGGRHGLELAGPRGGWTSLIQNQKRSDHWAHILSANKTVWYRRNPDFTFTRIS